MLFPRFLSKCQCNTSQDGARPALFQNCCVVLCIVCFVFFFVLFVCKCVLPPGDNPIAVNKYVISLPLSVKTVRKITQYSCSHPFSYHNLILHRYTKTQIILKRNEQKTAHGDCLLTPNSQPADCVSCT